MHGIHGTSLITETSDQTGSGTYDISNRLAALLQAGEPNGASPWTLFDLHRNSSVSARTPIARVRELLAHQAPSVIVVLSSQRTLKQHPPSAGRSCSFNPMATRPGSEMSCPYSMPDSCPRTAPGPSPYPPRAKQNPYLIRRPYETRPPSRWTSVYLGVRGPWRSQLPGYGGRYSGMPCGSSRGRHRRLCRQAAHLHAVACGDSQAFSRPKALSLPGAESGAPWLRIDDASRLHFGGSGLSK